MTQMEIQGPTPKVMLARAPTEALQKSRGSQSVPTSRRIICDVLEHDRTRQTCVNMLDEMIETVDREEIQHRGAARRGRRKMFALTRSKVI